MHKEAYQAMSAELAKINGRNLRVLDVGSLDVNGSYKPLITEREWHYTGLDIQDGRNVDVVTDDPFHYPFNDEEFDLIISGSTMEHVTAVWRWVPELARVLKPNGTLIIITHWQFKLHRYPVDCWRIMPDGMKYLFDETAVLDDYDIRILNDTDILGKAVKV